MKSTPYSNKNQGKNDTVGNNNNAKNVENNN